MKYPKLFDGPSPIGEGDVHALQRVDAPYLTKTGPNSRAIKAGEFNRVETGSLTPYWYTKYIDKDLRVLPLLLTPENGNTEDLKALHAPLGLGSFYSTRLILFVGDERVLFYVRDQSNNIFNDVIYWPRLEKIGAPTPRYDVSAAPDDKKGHSIDYHSLIQMTSLGQAKLSIGMFASGYDVAVKGYRWGISYLHDDDATTLVRRQPKMYVGDTKTLSAHAVTPPGETGRDMVCFTPFVVGAGKLQYLHGATEDLSYAQTFLGNVQPLVDPSFVTSTDHGESWTKTTPTFLMPVMSKYKIDFFGGGFPSRPAYMDEQLELMMRYTATFYLGAGKVMVFIPNGMMTGEDAAHDNPFDRAYQPMMFVGDALSATLARVAWPGDAWTVNYNGYTKNVGDYQIGFRRMADLRSAHFAFGKGCLFVPIIPLTTAAQNADLAPTHAVATTDWRIMVTRNFGASWDIVTTAPPTSVQNVTFGAFVATVMSPYVDSKKKGVLFFAGYDSVDKNYEVWATDGEFTKWRRILKKPAKLPAENNSNGTPFYDDAFLGVNYGNLLHKSSVFPAFPTEFGKS